MYYSKNYQKTTGTFYNFYRDDPNSSIQNDIHYSIKDSKSFDYKTSLIGKLEGNNTEFQNIKIAVRLKYLGKLFGSLQIPLINCEVSLYLKWRKNCELTSKVTREANPDADPAVIGINNPTNAEFRITDCKLYVSVITLSTECEHKLYQMLKKGFTVDVYWDRYRCQITSKRKGLINYLIDPTFDHVFRFTVLAYKNEEDRSSFSEYYTPSVEIKDYNVLIDQQPFFEFAVKSKKETYEKTVDTSKNLND